MQNDDLNPPPLPNVGDTIILSDDDGIVRFSGKVTEPTESNELVTAVAYDECYYLNKSKVTIQFTDSITTSEAIQALCKKIGITILKLPLLQNPVDAVYYATAPSNIIYDLLDKQSAAYGGKYYLTSESAGTISIYSYGSLSAGVSLSAIYSASRTQSLDSIKNRVTLLVKDGDNYTISETASNFDSISKYGLLQEYIETSLNADIAVAYVQNKLNELSALLDEGEITILGDWRLTQIGRRITVYEPITHLSGDYVIESVIHEISDGFHETTLSLKQYYEYTPFKTIISSFLAPELRAVEESRKSFIPDRQTISYADGKDAMLKIIGHFNLED